MSSKRSWAIIGGIMTSISRPGRWTSTLLSLPISLVTFSRMRAGFYLWRQSGVRSGRSMRVIFRLRPAQALPILLLCAIAPVLFGASPRITFERILPATHDVHAEDLALVQAIGDH